MTDADLDLATLMWLSDDLGRKHVAFHVYDRGQQKVTVFDFGVVPHKEVTDIPPDPTVVEDSAFDVLRLWIAEKRRVQ